MDRSIGSLQQEYCPPLDTALFAALVSDYDLSREDAVSELRAMLEALKEDAQRQEDLQRQGTWSYDGDVDASRSAESILARTTTTTTPATSSKSRDGGLDDDDDDDGHKRRGRSPIINGPEQQQQQPLSSRSDVTSTDITSLSEAMSLLNAFEDGYSAGAERMRGAGDDAMMQAPMDLQTKQAQLMEAFPDLQDVVVAQALADAGNDYDKAVDLLLNHIFIEEEGESVDDDDDYDEEEPAQHEPKGIDGFAAPDKERGKPRQASPYSGKKKKKLPNHGKRGRRRSDNGGGGAGRGRDLAWPQDARARARSVSPGVISDSGSAHEPTQQQQQQQHQNAWETATEDINFLASRLGWPYPRVASIYHDRGQRSVAATLRAILDGQSGVPEEEVWKDDMFDVTVAELREIYPTLPARQVFDLVCLTADQPDRDAAFDLAEQLSLAPPPQPGAAGGGGIEVVMRLPEINLEPASPGFTRRPRGSTTGVGRVAAVAAAAAGRGGTAGRAINMSAATEAAAQATHHRSEMQRLQTQAAAARRKAASDHLRLGQAAHYSAEIRQHEAKARQYEAVAADAWVAAQSTRPDELDLHGVAVKDAVRIARDAVEAWWSGLGEARYYGGGGGVGGVGGRRYRIVTGVGKHSRDGRARIGPAVAKMLIREGWKTSVGEGFVSVAGRARR